MKPQPPESETSFRRDLRGLRAIAALMLRANRSRALGVTLLTIINSAARISHAFWLKVLADSVVQARADLAFVGVSGFVGSMIIGGISNWAKFLLVAGLNERMAWLIEKELIAITAGVPGIEHFERPEYLNELDLLRQHRSQLAGLTTRVLNNVDTLVRTTITLALLGTLHPVLVALPLFAIPSLFLGTKAVGMQERVNEDLTEPRRASNHLLELTTTSGPGKELRIFSLGRELIGRHRRIQTDIDRELRRIELRTLGLTTLGWLVFALGYSGAMLLVVILAIQGRITAGDVLMAFNLCGQVNQQAAAVVGNASTLLRDLKAVRRYLWLLDYAGHAQDPSFESRTVPSRITKGIQLVNVSFVYPGTSEEVLRDVNLLLPAGRTIAIVGDNGAGKTTLVKLICRFYDPTSGSILLDGSDIRHFDHQEWRSCLSSGFQDYMNYEFIARENVGVGDLFRIDDVEYIQRALTRANAQDVIGSLTTGLETQLGRSFEGGAELSVGQWQKLALSRAMMRDPLVLILDEPTASLDSATEHALFERFAGAARRTSSENGAITILVSHRFSTVRMADLIVVVAGGRIVEFGSHFDLMSRGGLYSELYELQAQSYR